MLEVIGFIALVGFVGLIFFRFGLAILNAIGGIIGAFFGLCAFIGFVVFIAGVLL